MKLTYDSLKNLLDNSITITIPDSIPLEILLRIAEVAQNKNKPITLTVKHLGVEDLKRISKIANGNISFIIEKEQAE